MTNNMWISGPVEAAGKDGPLAGVKVAVKDNVDVVGFPTTAACPSFAYDPTETAPAVARLIDAGAAVVGKTNMDQFATGLVGTRSPHGPVDNPIRPGFISGGSSSGSAAAVATGQADLGIATDTAGSGRVPAALCGLVGLKGTRGWVPNRGVVPACPSFDCTTVMARTLDEAAVALRIMAGADPEDPSTRPRPARRFPPVTRIGVLSPAGLEGCDEDVLSAYRFAVDTATAAGFETVEVDPAAYFAAGMLLYEGSFVAERHASIGHVVDGDYPDLDPHVRKIVGTAGTLSASAYAADRFRLAQLAMDAAEIWSTVDAVMTPTVPFHPTLDQVAADPIGVNLALGRFVTGANLTDWSAAVLPIGPEPHSPGVQLLGPAWADESLWAAGAVLLDQPLSPVEADDDVLVAVLGAHLEGQPLNHQLTSRGGRLVEVTRSAAAYRMVVLEGPLPKPGLLRDRSTAASVELEVWRMGHLGYGQFVTEVPAPLTIGTIELEDGRTVQGFLCESEAAAEAPDISSFGGWRRWLERS